MDKKFNGTIVETNGVRSIAGGGTNADTATGALANLGGYPASNPNGYITGIDTSNFYTNDNPSGFISGDLSTLYPRSNPSGFISGDLSLLYPNSNPSGFISGISQFNYVTGDLTGSLLSPTLSNIQGNQIIAHSPSAGQSLQWNGTAWVPGSIPNGGNGGGGITYYLNFGNTTGIAPTGGLPINVHSPSQLGRNYSVGSGLVESTNLAQTGYNLICGFVTVSGDPGITNIPAGLWDFNIWADVVGGNGQGNQTQFQVKTYKYSATSGTYTSLANSDDVYIYDPNTTAQYIANVTMPQTTILDTDRIYVELWAKKNVSSTRQVRFYFDSLHPSHGHTTLPSVAGNGVVKVINGVFQTPASKIIDNDVDVDAAIQQSKIQNLTGDLAAFYPRSNPSGFISGDLSTLYPRSNPSGFISGVPNSVYTTGDQTVSGIKTFREGLEVGEMLNVSTLYIMSGAVGVNNENPQASLDVSGLAIFSQRPAVNGTGIVLSGDINTANFYLNNNPSGFITGIQNLFYATGDQTISGIKTFTDELYVKSVNGQVAVMYVESGKVGINNENPQASLDVSGSVLFSERPTVNTTGIMLSGEVVNHNIISFYHSPSSLIASGLLYFSNLQLPPSSDIANRRVTIMEKIVAKKAAWSAYCATTGNPADVDYTGYFINNTKSTTGIISSSIKVSGSSSLFNYTGNINPEIQVDAGDLVSIGINAPNSIGAPINFQNSVDIYFYK